MLKIVHILWPVIPIRSNIGFNACACVSSMYMHEKANTIDIANVQSWIIISPYVITRTSEYTVFAQIRYIENV